ncbi:MAG: cupin domain-containing protein [Chloroflexi bacterium]|nr:cupin domain-containing protein [Chloroflexota bacterium]
MNAYHWFEDLNTLIDHLPADSIVSRTIYQDEQIKAVLFGFAPGQALSEHTAAQPAIIHIVRGEAALTLDTDSFDAQAGAWVHMPPRLRHSVSAKSELIMLLLLLK